ncbi:MAG: LysE/ArgO family amino acid transporter [Burkholderiaceae bacterium]
MITAASHGFVMLIGVTAAVGAQNSWVLNRGVAKNHHLTTATVCWVCDLALLALGVFGQTALFGGDPQLISAITIAGIVFLMLFSLTCLNSAHRTFRIGSASKSEISKTNQALKVGAVILGTLAVTLLNPHVYLDRIVIMGSVANETYADSRYSFYAGAVLGAIFWFYLLSFAAAKMGPLLSGRKVRIGIDLSLAIMMMAIAISLAISL